MKIQAQALMNELLGFAEKMLAEHGEFHPFGGYLKNTGDVVHVGVDATAGKTAREKIDALVVAFKRLTDEACAFGIAVDVGLPRATGSKGDAVHVFLEHKDGYCADVFFRYEKSADDSVRFTEATAQEGDPTFFISRAK